MSAKYPFGEQPCYNVLKAKGYTLAVAARVCNLTYHRLYHALRGGGKIPQDVRTAMVNLLERPAEELFTNEALGIPSTKERAPIQPSLSLAEALLRLERKK